MTHPMGDFELIPVKEARAMRARVAELVEAYAARIVELEAQRAENARLRAALSQEHLGYLDVEYRHPGNCHACRLIGSPVQTTEPPGGK